MLYDFERYAVYWVPGRSDDLSRFGAAWLGWCAETGETHPRPAGAGLSAEICACTRDISRHGIHGIIRAPFRLAPRRSRWSVEHALQAVAEEIVVFPLPRFELAVVDGRVALQPASADAELQAGLNETIARVAAAVAPLTSAGSDFSEALADRQRRRGAGALHQLPQRGAQRFHVPLTDRPDLKTAFRVMEELRPWLEPLLDQPRRFSDLALMGDPGGGRPLRVLQRFELRDAPPQRSSQALPCSGRQTLVATPDDPMIDAGIAV